MGPPSPRVSTGASAGLHRAAAAQALRGDVSRRAMAIASSADMESDYQQQVRQGHQGHRPPGHSRECCSATHWTCRAASVADAASMPAWTRTTSPGIRRFIGSASSRWRRRRASIWSSRTPTTTPDGAGEGVRLLHAGGLPAMPKPTLCTQGLSGQGHMAGARRHRRHRLRLVHRLPVLHVGLPLWRPPLQLGRSRDPWTAGRGQPGYALPGQPTAPEGAWWRNARSASTG